MCKKLWHSMLTVFLSAVLLGAFSSSAWADGTETLGPPSVPIATGTDIIAAGTGLIDQPGTITLDLPNGVTVKQVLLYWEGQMFNEEPGDPTIIVNGTEITGSLIGGEAFFFGFAYSSAYRADITNLNLVSAGPNTLTVEGLSYTKANNGAGILVIYDDGTTAVPIDVRDGLDLAFINFPEPRKSTVPQTFTFAPAGFDRIAELSLFFSSVSGSTSGADAERPSSIEVTVDGTTTVFDNELGSLDGEEWDTVNLPGMRAFERPIVIPAGATSLTVQAFSRDDLGTGKLPASFAWTAAAFSVLPPGAIGDTVWQDNNGNGVQDAGEPGIPGVTVDLKDPGPDGLCGTADDVVLGTTTTDANGNYLFDDLPQGTYCVDPDENTVPAGLVLTTNNDPQTVDLNAGEIYLDADFGYQPPQPKFTLGDRVWYDQNQNGIQDPGEPGYNGVTVQLFNMPDCSHAPIASTTTAAGPAGFGDGFYEFTDLPAGNYCVQFGNIPAGWSISPANQGDGTNDSKADNNARIPNISLTADDPNEDLGIYVDGSLGDTVICDSTGLGLPNITVTLFADFDGNGVADGPALATTETDANGVYGFSGLEVALAGDPNNLTQYIVQVDVNDADLGSCNVPTSPTEYNPPLDSDNPDDPNNDFTFEEEPTGTIGDTVWQDNNGNGVQDAGEPGIPGVTVELNTPGPDGQCGTADDVTVGSAVTDATGNYLFTDLPAGIYCVDPDENTVPAGLVLTTNNDPETVDLGPGETFLDADFGYQPLGTIGDTVWQDNNGNGVQDAGEPGIPGVTVTLKGPGPDATCGTADDVTFGSVVTDANGNYLFIDLPAGVYCVDPDENTVPAGLVLTTNNDPETVDLGPGETFLDADFGYQPQPKFTLGDRVWYDQNQNGIQDPGEPGYNGATVQLYNMPDCSHAPIASTTTAAGPAGFGDGFYQFTDLPAGDYCVQFGNIPAGWSISPANQGDGTNDSKADNNARIPNISLTADDPNEDLGIYVDGSLGDTVICDSTGLGLPNITVTLFADFDGNGVADGPALATTETDANGVYGFSGLEVALAGDPNNLTQYIVQVDVNDADLGSCNVPTSPTEYNPPLDSDNPDDPNNDFTFEEEPTFTLGDRVWYDQNQNGIQDAGEPGYNGVTVQLFNMPDCSHAPIASTTTAAGPAGFGDGFYEFTDLPAGDYCVQFGNIPAGWSISPANQGDGTNDSKADNNARIPNINLTADDPNEDMGIYVDGSLGDTVICDSTGLGLPNITVTLFADFDGNGVADGPALATTETDANGVYGFSGLEVALAGDPNNLTQYIVQVDVNDADLGSCNVPTSPTEYNPPLDSDNPDDPNNDFTFEEEPTGTIGDTVWQDNNGNGVQDAGEPGIPGVTVELNTPGPDGQCGTADDVTVGSAVTDANGNYLFTDLPAGIYCVDPDEDTVPAGLVLTTNNDPETVDLGPGETFLDADFGYQPLGTIGDTVWQDNNGNGVQDAGEPGIPGVTVDLNTPGPDGQCGTADDVTVGSDVTDANGNYLFTDLPAGVYCADPDENTVPAGFVLTTNNDPETVDLGPGEEFLDADFGYQPVLCNLVVDKKCAVPPPVTSDLTCDAKIAATTLRYIGPDLSNATVQFVPKDGDSSTVTYSNVDLVSGDTILTMPSQNGFTIDSQPNDLGSKLTIRINGVEELIHTSCSVPFTAGEPAPLDNPKGNPSPNWFVENFVDKDGDFSAIPSDPQPADSCTITPSGVPSCQLLKDNGEKLTSLTFKYTGAGCPGSNSQGDKSECTGSINPAAAVTVQAGEKADELEYPVSPSSVAPGAEFTVNPEKFKSNSFIVISNGGGTETNELHTSCSQPLQVGDTFGSLELVAINGERAGSQVTYFYEVTNFGDPMANISVEDDKLGTITSGLSLDTGESATFEVMTEIFGTTTNTANAFGQLIANGQACAAPSDSVTVTVEEPEEPCDVCKGGTTELTLQYQGTNSAQVIVYDDSSAKADKILFQGTVTPGEEFTLTPRAGQSKLSSEISIYVNGVLNTKIHTSCSQPIGPGLVSGDFEVTEARSKDNGPMCPLSACEPQAAPSLEFDKEKLKWEVTNNGDLGLEIERVTISWPAGFGNLVEMKAEGTFFKGSLPPTSAVVTSGWDGDVKDRTLKPGDTKKFEFKFANETNQSGEVEITIDFTAGCSISVNSQSTGGGGNFTCEKPIDSLTMIWDGSSNINVTAWKGSVGSTNLGTQSNVMPGEEVSFNGFAGSPNDVYWEIFDTNGTKIGESTFHLSCSDKEMDGPEDCGSRQGNGKNNSSSLINDWLLEGMVDKTATLDCTAP